VQEAAAAQHARAGIMQSEATALHARAQAMRKAADQAMAEVEAQRRADQRKRTVPRRLRVSDANGLDLRPDPSTARTPAEYIEAVRQFRVWAGNPSFRDIAKRCGGRPVASTICKILQGDELPGRFESIDAIIIACGATDEDRQRFATAWRQQVPAGAQSTISPACASRRDPRMISKMVTSPGRAGERTSQATVPPCSRVPLGY